MQKQLLDKLGIDSETEEHIERSTRREWKCNMEQAEFTLQVEPGVLICGALPGGQWDELDALERLQLVVWFKGFLGI